MLLIQVQSKSNCIYELPLSTEPKKKRKTTNAKFYIPFFLAWQFSFRVLMGMSIYDSAIYVNNFYALHKYAFGFYEPGHHPTWPKRARSDKGQDEAVKSISGWEKMTFPKTLLSNQRGEGPEVRATKLQWAYCEFNVVPPTQPAHLTAPQARRYADTSTRVAEFASKSVAGAQAPRLTFTFEMLR